VPSAAASAAPHRDTGAGPAARFVCDDVLPPDPLRERALALVRGATAPLSSDALRTTLGVRKQTLLARTVPVPDSMGGNGNAPAD